MVLSLHYSLDSKTSVNWNAAQEKSLSTDFPFDLEQESDDQFVVRTYLQFLWLPESIMPLKLLVPSLLRVVTEPSQPHALHTHLKPLLQTARSASRKYNAELPQILSNGGGAGEIEETMMWYALSHEKADDDLWTRTSAIREGPWEDETWRRSWLERMERREFQIQIILYFLKLSLPGPPPPPPSPKKGKRKRSKEETEVEPPPEECLEIFMDKLSMWQLMQGLEDATKPLHTLPKEKPLDWMQAFFEEVIKPQFEKQLPDLCSLMRSKIFPNSPFSSSSGPSSPSSSRATSPDIPHPPKHSSSVRDPSPALSTTTTASKTKSLVRNRSRSLSVSLAQERMERERSVTAGPPKKRVLNREVSMSRAFKPKPKRPEPTTADNTKKAEAEHPPKKETKDEGVLLVEATPTKPKLARSQSQSQAAFGNADGTRSRGQSFVIQSSLGVGGEEEEDDEEEEWHLPGSSSPDVLLLGPGRLVDDARAAGVLADSTPTKRSRLR